MKSSKDKKLFSRVFYAIHDFLDVGQAPEKAECIFVYAGRPERKDYALTLFRRGYANHIVFSVGRFEWRGFLTLGLEQDGGLAKLVQKTPPPKRHFFVEINNQRTRCFLIEMGMLGTWRENLALADLIRQQNIRKLIIMSTAFHLRRAHETLRRNCAGIDVKIIPVAVPENLASEARTRWWANHQTSRLIVKEYLKYFCYKFLLLVTRVS